MCPRNGPLRLSRRAGCRVRRGGRPSPGTRTRPTRGAMVSPGGLRPAASPEPQEREGFSRATPPGGFSRPIDRGSIQPTARSRGRQPTDGARRLQPSASPAPISDRRHRTSRQPRSSPSIPPDVSAIATVVSARPRRADARQAPAGGGGGAHVGGAPHADRGASKRIARRRVARATGRTAVRRRTADRRRPR